MKDNLKEIVKDRIQMSFIKGTPMQSPSHFTGPISWWCESLKYDDSHRQLLSSAQALKDAQIPITLLCKNLSPEDKNDFYLKKANKIFHKIYEFSAKTVDDKYVLIAHKIINSFITGCSQKYLSDIASYTSWLLKTRPRLLHIWDADLLPPLLAAVIAGVPKIIIAGQNLSPAVRSAYVFDERDDKLVFAVLSNLLRLHNVVMTNNSRAGCITYEEWLGLPPNSIILTPNIINYKNLLYKDTTSIQSIRKRLGIPKESMILGGFFQFDDMNDADLWVSTAVRACEANHNLIAVAVGHGPDLAPIKKRLARTSFSDRILLPGIIEDVQTFISSCAIFLHTPYVDGLPSALIEAQFSKIPVVTTDCCGAEDIIEHNKSGYIINDRNDIIISKHIIHLLKNTEILQNFGNNGHKRAIDKYNHKFTFNKLLTIYNELHNSANKTKFCTSNDHTKSCDIIELKSNEYPLVSIVLPTYNHIDFLPQAIESILTQSYQNFELIIVDDGSTDGTANYLASLSSPKIKVLSGPNTRLPTALNRGFALAQGEYLTWTSADNICLPQFCNTLVKAMQTYQQAGFASASFTRVNVNGFVIDRHAGKATLENIICYNPGIAAFMYKRYLADKVGPYDAKLEGAEDWDMWLRILDCTHSVHIPYAIYHYRYHHNSMTFKISEKIRNAATRTAYRAITRLKIRGGINALFPQIEMCRDKKLALFHANLILGTKMIERASFLKGASIDYLEAAYSLHPNNIAAIGNYALALTWHGRWNEAQQLFRRGKEKEPQLFSLLQTSCDKQRIHAGSHEFACQPIPCPGPNESELQKRISNEQLIYSNFSWRHYAF